MRPPPPIRRHTISVLVENEFGALGRVIGLFSGRGYNIESLTVAEVDATRNLSRITIVTSGSDMMIEQIKNLLDRLVPIHKVVDLTTSGAFVEREMAFIKVRGIEQHRVEALRIADIFRAKVVDATLGSFIFEITGSSEKINTFTELMRPLGLCEVCRTGAIAMGRGEESIMPKPVEVVDEAPVAVTTKAKPKNAA